MKISDQLRGPLVNLRGLRSEDLGGGPSLKIYFLMLFSICNNKKVLLNRQQQFYYMLKQDLLLTKEKACLYLSCKSFFHIYLLKV